MGQQVKWGPKTKPLLDASIEVIDRLADFWPLTLRQIYYQLVAALIIKNHISQYKKLSRILTQARLDGFVQWEAIEDRSRTILQASIYGNKSKFVHAVSEYMREGYRRDLLQDQAVRPILWIEKDALAHILFEIAQEYGVLVVSGKGFGSTTIMDQVRNRIELDFRCGQKTEIQYRGDLDPSGWCMPISLEKILYEGMGLEGKVTVCRCALNLDQVSGLDLPTSLDAIKEKDTRTPGYRAWLRKQGVFDDLAVELDAIPPDVLQDQTRDGLESILDLSKIREQHRIESNERQYLGQLATKMKGWVSSHG